jgi:cytochrome c oxidase assembly protein subunit 15
MTGLVTTPQQNDTGLLPGRLRLYRFAVGVVIAVLLLIKVGAMVTSTGSGMAFPDWPLSNGSWWPPDMHLDQLLEHGHRAIGAFIGLLTVTLASWVFFVERRIWLRNVCAFAVGLVIVQGLIGGTHVLNNAPYASGVVHGVLAQVFLATVAFIAFALSPAWRPRTDVGRDLAISARKWSVLALVCILVQLFLGAVGRHSGDTWFVWAHVGFAIPTALFLSIAAVQARARFGAVPGFPRLSAWLMSGVGVQILLGFVTLLVRRPKDASNIEHIGLSLLVTVHVLVGATLMLLTALMVFKSFRNLAASRP